MIVTVQFIFGVSYVKTKRAQCFCLVTRQVDVSSHVILALSFLQGFRHHGNRFFIFSYCHSFSDVLFASLFLVHLLLPCITVLRSCVFRSAYYNFDSLLSSFWSLICSHLRVNFHIFASIFATNIDSVTPPIGQAKIKKYFEVLEVITSNWNLN